MPWSLIAIAGCFLAFGTLARFFACNPDQPRFATRELIDNLLYWAMGILFFSDLSAVLLKLAIDGAFGARGPRVLATINAGYGVAPHLPLLAQAFLVLLATDIMQYWLHRAFHGTALWPFHAIHHSAEQVDWSTTYRFHPVNFAIYSAGVAAIVRLGGFSPGVFVILAPFNLVFGALVHANLNWTFGPLRYVIASPVFHRWHHVRDPQLRNKNFAPTFPLLDLLFGTFHMPKGELPQTFGAEGTPNHFALQLIYPFQAIAARNVRARPAPLPGEAG